MDDSKLIWWVSQLDCTANGDPSDLSNKEYLADWLEDWNIVCRCEPRVFMVAKQITHNALLICVLDTSVWAAPEYLKSEYSSRIGRAGRGRLWSAPELQVDGIEWDEEKARELHLNDSHGGIVIWADDVKHLQGFAGIITDLNLNKVEA